MPYAAALSPRTSLRVRSTEDEDSPERATAVRSPRPVGERAAERCSRAMADDQVFSKNEAVRSPLWGTHGWFSLLEGCNAGTAEAQMTKFSMYFLLRRRESRIFSRLPSKARSSTSMHTGPS